MLHRHYMFTDVETSAFTYFPHIHAAIHIVPLTEFRCELQKDSMGNTQIDTLVFTCMLTMKLSEVIDDGSCTAPYRVREIVNSSYPCCRSRYRQT
jgi:hypothetical protein